MDSQIDRNRLIVPGMAGVYQRFAPYSYAFMRFVTGAILVPHGIQKVFTAPIDRYIVNIGGKGIPFSELLAYLVFFTESAGAICLAIGLFTRIAAAMIFIQMMVIVIVFQGPYGFFWTNRGFEYPLLWAAFCLAIFFRGGGRWSVDHYIGKEF